MELLLLVECLSSSLHSKCSISDIDSSLSECFLEFEIEQISDIWLIRRFLIEPQTHLIRMLFVIEAVGKLCVFNYAELQ